jgi:hypothetical protein
MDVSELRKRILRAIDDARRESESRRTIVDESVKAFEAFLQDTAVPLLRQAAQVLNATGHAFVVHTPAGRVRLAADKAPDTFIEIDLDRSGPVPQAIGRVSLTRGRQGVVIEERPIVADRAVSALTEDDVSAFLVAEVPRLVLKP